MNDRTVERADRLERGVLTKVARMYPAAFAPVLARHKGTLDKLDKLMQSGASGRARTLARQSGLLRDVAAALASVGAEAAALIRAEMAQIREAVADEPEAAGESGADR